MFDAKVTWPTMSGFPIKSPAIWSGLRGALRFPFKSTFQYTGRSELMLDYVFRGGKLANNGYWHGQFPAQRHYILDGEVLNTRYRFGLVDFWPRRRHTCADSFFGGVGQRPAMVEGRCTAYPGKVTVEYRTILTALSAPVIHGVGLALHRPGVDLGAKCNKLHIDFRQPWMAEFRTAGARFGGTPWTRRTVNWTSSLSHFTFYVQGAWTDSVTKQLALTNAVVITLPIAPPPASLPRQKALYSRFADLSVAEAGPFASSYHPYVRFVTR